MKEKVFGYITASNNLEIDLELNINFYKEVSKKFPKFYILQLNKLIYKTPLKKVNNKILKKFKNFKIFCPNSYGELHQFLKFHKLIAFISLGRTFEYFLILLLLKIHNCKLLINLNIGFKNSSANKFIHSNKNIRKNIYSYISFILKKRISFIIFRLFVLINIFPKIEILFEGSRRNAKIIDNYIGKKIIKYFPLINISYIKKVIHINCRSYDELISKKKNICQKYIVFLDSHFDHDDTVASQGKQEISKRKKYYFYLNKILNILQKKIKKEVIICAHPKNDLKTLRHHLSKFKIVKFKTRYYIIKSYLVLFHESSAIIDAIFLNKKIINLRSNTMGNYYKQQNKTYSLLFKIPHLIMERYYNLDKSLFYKNLIYKKTNYNNYIQDLITFNINDYNKILNDRNKANNFLNLKFKKGSSQIINIVKTSFF